MLILPKTNLLILRLMNHFDAWFRAFFLASLRIQKFCPPKAASVTSANVCSLKNDYAPDDVKCNKLISHLTLSIVWDSTAFALSKTRNVG